jgi:hypothetical protein
MPDGIERLPTIESLLMMNGRFQRKMIVGGLKWSGLVNPAFTSDYY